MNVITIKGKPYEVIANQSAPEIGLAVSYYVWELPRKDKESPLFGFRNPDAMPGTFEYGIIAVLKPSTKSGTLRFRKVGIFNENTSIDTR